MMIVFWLGWSGVGRPSVGARTGMVITSELITHSQQMVEDVTLCKLEEEDVVEVQANDETRGNVGTSWERQRVAVAHAGTVSGGRQGVVDVGQRQDGDDGVCRGVQEVPDM